MKEFTINGMMYDWEIINVNGCSVVVYPEPEHTQKQIAFAINEIRRKLDVVTLRVATEADRDHQYMGAILRDPRVRTLEWDKINLSNELIREQRIKGTTPQQYVKEFVLPFIDRGGNSI